MNQKQPDIPQGAAHGVRPATGATSEPTGVSTDAPRALIPHVGWFAHEPGDEVVRMVRQGCFEAEEQAFVWLYLRPGDWFFDCGAHIGLYSVLAARATGDRTLVFSIEASDETARLLERNLRDNHVTQARVFRSAIWNAPGTVRFLPEEASRSAFAHVAFGQEGSSGGIEVPAITIDQLLEISGSQEIALAKLDLEGAEPEALEGAASCLARGACAAWMIEFTEANLERRGWSTEQLASTLGRQGLGLFQYSSETREMVPFTLSGPVWYRNLLATRDVNRVNARLRSASAEHVEIAQDVLDRARACNRLKELEDLDQTRALATSNRQWALNVEALLEGEKARAREAERRAAEGERRAAEAERRAHELERRTLAGLIRRIRGDKQ